jgi:hypothetical protein
MRSVLTGSQRRVAGIGRLAMGAALVGSAVACGSAMEPFDQVVQCP